MYEPEETDDATPPGMRRVFDDLEAEFEAGLRREAEQETVAAVRAELGSTLLWSSWLAATALSWASICRRGTKPTPAAKSRPQSRPLSRRWKSPTAAGLRMLRGC